MLRKERLMSQTEVAEKAGVNPMTVSRIERGMHAPSTATLEKIARGLGVSFSELLE